MTTELATQDLPKHEATGLTLPLSKSLSSQDLAAHRAMVGFEQEVLAKRLDRFGWERDRGTPVHDRLVKDWMSALQDFPLDEIQEACRVAVIQGIKKPDEGAILRIIQQARAERVKIYKAQQLPKEEPKRDRVTAERAAAITAELGFAKRVAK